MASALWATVSDAPIDFAVWGGETSFNLHGPGEGAEFGDGPKYFFHYDPADTYFFPATWSSIYLFHFHFVYVNYILKAIIYFNRRQLQIMYFTIFLP